MKNVVAASYAAYKLFDNILPCGTLEVEDLERSRPFDRLRVAPSEVEGREVSSKEGRNAAP